MSLAQFFRILFARRLIILATLVAAMVAAVALCQLLPARFPATARVLMDVIKPDPVSGQVIASNFVRGYTQTQQELITDYRVAGDVVDRLGWANDPAIVAEYNAHSDGTSDFRRFEAQHIIDATDAKLVEGSNILEITYKGGNPIIARNVVTALRTAFIDASLRLRTDAAGRSADWYVDQAAKAQAALATAENRKSEFERTNGIVMAPGGADSETMKLEQMQGALLTARSSLGFSRSVNGPSPAVESLKSQVNSLDDAMVEASQRLGTAHPTYIGLVERRKVLVQQLARETAAARASAGANAGNDGGATIARLASDLDSQKVKVLALKSRLDELAQLQREVDLRKGQYESAAQRAANLKLEANVSETELVSLGEAFVSGKPSFPNKPLILGLSFFSGLVIGVFAAIVTELVSRRIRGPEDLAQAANVAVMAVIAATAPAATQRRFTMFGRRRDLIALQAAE